MKVKKRNGDLQEFDISKIENAIIKANKEVDEYHKIWEGDIPKMVDDIYYEITSGIYSSFLPDYIFDIEEIQDAVELCLQREGYYELAKRYIKYRYQRQLVREIKRRDEGIMELLDGENEELNVENSNKDVRLISTTRDYMAGEVSKDIVKMMYDDDIIKAHEQGIIHLHDTDYISCRMNNCFSGDTKFITSQGTKTFEEIGHGNECIVPNQDGVWSDATVINFGKQDIYELTFKRQNGMRKTVRCTNNHRWILEDGSSTTELSIGDKLIETPIIESFSVDNMTDEEKYYWCVGFAIGDGSDIYVSDTNYGCRVRLCDKKNKYSNLFESAGYNYYYAKDKDDKIFYMPKFSKQDFLDEASWINLSKENIIALVNGLVSADGRFSGEKYARSIQISDERVYELLINCLEVAGYYVSRVTDIVGETNYGKRKFCKEIGFNRKQYRVKWQLIEKKYIGEEDVWCCVVENKHSFILSGGMVTGNCGLVNLEDMLQNGTAINGTLVEKPHSFRTACTITTQIVAQVASSQYGGQTITLSHLAPFVDVSRQKIKSQVSMEFVSLGFDLESEEITEEAINEIVEDRLKQEIKDGIQTLQYQLITLNSTNGQSPFVTVFMYIDEVPEGQTRDDLVMIIEEMLKQRIQGIKNEQGAYVTVAFPKLIYCLDEDNCKEGTKYWWLTKLSAECSSKRLVPDYISAKKMRELKGDVYPCMGCRSFLTPDEKNHKYYGRFNQGVVTISLPDVALSSGGDFDKFWELMEERLQLCYRALMIRHNRLMGTKADVAPVLWMNGAYARLKSGETIDYLLFDNYSTISLGYAGLYECVKYMTGHSHTEQEGHDFAIEVMKSLNDHCAKWREDTNISFSLYGSPIESTTYKFAKCLQKRFGSIDGITDKKYVTNSYHVTPSEPIDAFTKFDIESEFQELSPGGAISYVETPNMEKNVDAVLEIIKHIYENIMYAEINTTTSYCHVCGCTDIKMGDDLKYHCPQCGNDDFNKMNIAVRVCGYISTNPFNEGRAQDIHDRVYHLGME